MLHLCFVGSDLSILQNLAGELQAEDQDVRSDFGSTHFHLGVCKLAKQASKSPTTWYPAGISTELRSQNKTSNHPRWISLFCSIQILNCEL